jgi:hypothetical protein
VGRASALGSGDGESADVRTETWEARPVDDVPFHVRCSYVRLLNHEDLDASVTCRLESIDDGSEILWSEVACVETPEHFAAQVGIADLRPLCLDAGGNQRASHLEHVRHDAYAVAAGAFAKHASESLGHFWRRIVQTVCPSKRCQILHRSAQLPSCGRRQHELIWWNSGARRAAPNRYVRTEIGAVRPHNRAVRGRRGPKHVRMVPIDSNTGPTRRDSTSRSMVNPLVKAKRRLKPSRGVTLAIRMRPVSKFYSSGAMRTGT